MVLLVALKSQHWTGAGLQADLRDRGYAPSIF